MIRAVVWKELREQGLIAIMLAVLGGTLLVATAMLADPPIPGAPATDVFRSIGASGVVTLMLVVTAGMVCGGALFAAEKEAGTMAFLDALPSPRLDLWRAKVVAGLVLAAVQVGLLVGVAAVLHVADGAFAQRLAVYALMAFAWGTLGSTVAATTLGSVGVAIPAATLATFVFLLPVSVVFAQPGSAVPRPTGWAIYALLMLAAPLMLSAWRFTSPDRVRAADAGAPAPVRTAIEPAHSERWAGSGGRALVWLSVRQLCGPGAILAAFAFAFGSALLLPDLRPVFLWPFLTLSVGALTGVIVFGDEQARRSAPFWSEQRLPLGRAWWVKIALGGCLLAGLLVLLALPSIVRSQFGPVGRFGYVRTTFSAVFQSPLFDELGAQSWKYLLVPAVYGFALGHLCGLLFRKLVVACGVAVMVGGAGAALWVPSLLAGGVSHWQVWLPPAVVLLTGRVLMRAWTADRLTDRGPFLRLIGGGGAAAIALAAGIGYRVVQVPDDPGGGDDLAFVAGQPIYDENKGGREFRSAAERFARAYNDTQPGDRAPDRRPPRLDEQLESVVRNGWRAPDPELGTLGAWLKRMSDEEPTTTDDKPWPLMASAAADQPIGIYEPPRLVSTAAATATALDNGRRMALVLLARGLQLQAEEKDAAAFVPRFRTVLALARTMRTGSGVMALSAGIEVERRALFAAERWLDRLGPGGDLSRTVGAAAAEGDDPDPFDTHNHVLADRYVVRELMKAPASWLTPALVPVAGTAEQAAPEADLVAFAWSVPWEKERTRRLVGLTPDGVDRGRMFEFVAGRPGAVLLAGRNRPTADLIDSETLLRVLRRAVILKAAIRTYQAEHYGTAPASLADLVPGYLASVPHDPFAEGHQFGYRVSRGEELREPARPTQPGRQPDEPRRVTIQPGQAVFWSVGTDHLDQGGRAPPAAGGDARGEDLVYVVPLPVP